MLHIIKKVFERKEDSNIYSPVEGDCHDIRDCKDITFCSGLIGDGFMIDPESDYICAPSDGVLTMVFPTKHAFGIKLSNNSELLIHIGLETVNLSGNGFTFLSKLNKKIKRGEKIMKCDFEGIRKKGYEVPVIVVMTGEQQLKKQNIGSKVTLDDVIITV